MSTSRTLSAAEQRSIISASNIAVRCIVNFFIQKTGLQKDFFCEEELEDISGETLCHACRSLDTYDKEQSKLTTWVSRIAMNCVKDAIDYKMKRLDINHSLYSENRDNGDEFDSTEVADEHTDIYPELYSKMNEYNPETVVCRREFEEEVYGQVGRLSEKSQRYTKLLVEGYTPKEMAEMEGSNANAAAKRVFDIRKALRAGLAELAHEFEVYGINLAC